MPAPAGNQFWKQRSTHGRAPIFDDPEKLESACEEYYQWVEDNPLEEARLFKVKNSENQDEIIQEPVPKMRAMTIAGMCLYLDISVDTWENYRKKEDFVGVTKRAEQIIYTQKFSGAAADLLNPNIIARDLGLKDATSKEISGPDGGPVEITDMTDSQLDTKLQELLNAIEQP